jgi:hypothetical protein
LLLLAVFSGLAVMAIAFIQLFLEVWRGWKLHRRDHNNV